MASQNTETIKALYEALGRGDIPFVASVMDERIEWNEAENFLYSDHNPYIGLPAILEGVFSRLGGEWQNFSVVPQEILGSGETVVVFGRYGGTFKETGKTVNAQFVHVFRFQAGKINRFQQYTDTAQFRDVAGHSQAAGA